jgi:hypothetical protein
MNHLSRRASSLVGGNSRARSLIGLSEHGRLEAIDGTPVVDIKPVLSRPDS